MPTHSLAYGLADAVPETAPAAWGARLIINMDGYVDFPPGRMDVVGDPHAIKSLLDLLGERFPPSALSERIREGLDRREFTTRTSETVTLYADADVTVVANPRGSAGYLYVAAFPNS